MEKEEEEEEEKDDDDENNRIFTFHFLKFNKVSGSYRVELSKRIAKKCSPLPFCTPLLFFMELLLYLIPIQA